MSDRLQGRKTRQAASLREEFWLFQFRCARLKFRAASSEERARIPARYIATPQKTPETSFLTNPTHRGRKGLVQDRVQGFRVAEGHRAIATSLRIGAQADVRRQRERRWRCRSPQLCRIGWRCVSNNLRRDHRDRFPCSARTELAPARGFRSRSDRAETPASSPRYFARSYVPQSDAERSGRRRCCGARRYPAACL